MDLQLRAMKIEALNFCETSENGIQLLKMDENPPRFHFSCISERLCFYICPTTSTSTSWSLWSDSSMCHEKIASILDSFDVESSQNVTEILQHVDTFLSKSKWRSQRERRESDSCEEEDDADESCDDENDGYYVVEDTDAVKDVAPKEDTDEFRSFATGANEMAVKRLMKDLKVIHTESSKFGIAGGPIGDDIFHWEMKLMDIPKESTLGKNLQQYANQYKQEPVITLDILFPSDFPFSPPFIRILRPRFKFLTGHVTVGGSICMEALTKSGWRPTNDIESILVQVRSEILSDPKASLDPLRANVPYSLDDAKAAFQRMAEKYRWN